MHHAAGLLRWQEQVVGRLCFLPVCFLPCMTLYTFLYMDGEWFVERCFGIWMVGEFEIDYSYDGNVDRVI